MDASLLNIAGVLVLGMVTYKAYQYMTQEDSSKKASTSAPASSQGQDEAGDAGKPKLKVFYGSQSGTAEAFAEELAAEGKLFGFNACAVDLEDYDHESELEEESFCVFLMATFGEGEPTDNAADFYEWIVKAEVDDDTYSELTFAVFSLGNRQYENFCNIGRNIDKQLYKMGAQRLGTNIYGEGDDDGTLDDDFYAWKELFWPAARKHFGIEGAGAKQQKLELPYTLLMSYHKQDPNFGDDLSAETQTDKRFDSYVSGVEGFSPDSKFKARLVPVVVNRELRQDTSDARTKHIELDISKSSLRYMTADNLGVFSHNDHRLVAAMCKRLGVHGDSLFSLHYADAKTANASKKVFPRVCSIQDALLWYCDFTAMPRVSALKTMALYCTEEKEKLALLSAFDSEESKKQFLDDQKDFLEILLAYPSMDLPLSVLFHLVPNLVHQPRYYTISSSSQASPDRISITVVTSKAKKPNGRTYSGICSTYLCNLQPKMGGKTKICVFVRPSTFRLPRNVETPIIMVGPGTGVAPFRAFWEQGQLVKKKNEKTLGEWLLFFGCRNESKDFIYKDEMTQAQEDGVIDLNVAFSRDGKVKVYVQDLLQNEETGKRVWDLLSKKKGMFYVCGGTLMGRAVKNAVIELAQTYGGLTEPKAKGWVKKQQDQHRYIQELWS